MKIVKIKSMGKIKFLSTVVYRKTKVVRIDAIAKS
jgi:hypothetical protein